MILTATAHPECARLLRIQALSTELDAQRQFVVDRGKIQETKASLTLLPLDWSRASRRRGSLTARSGR